MQVIREQIWINKITGELILINDIRSAYKGDIHCFTLILFYNGDIYKARAERRIS